MSHVMCIDNSGSTEGCTEYWKRVLSIYASIQPRKLIFWNTEATIESEFRQYSTGGTQPQSFVQLLEDEITEYDLIITTDGEIYENDMEECGKRVTPKLLSLIKSTTIHYVGPEEYMNIGLNIIFGSSTKMTYHINEKSYELLDDNIDELTLDEVMSPNFAISLITKIKNIQMKYPEKAAHENKLGEMRRQICQLFSKIEHDALPTEDNFELYYRNNQTKEFVGLLARDRVETQSISQQKCTILNLFDRKIDFNISRICAATAIKEQDIEIPPEIDTEWSKFEDSITLDQFNLPCLLVKDSDSPLITENTLLKHPFKLLSEPDIVKGIMQLIEPNLIDYTTYQKLKFNHFGQTTSPYTRAKCAGVFLLEAGSMKCVKNNCRVMSHLFGNGKKVPGNLVLWNLTFTYLLYKHKFHDSEYNAIILDQIIKYCKKFTVSLSFSHQCQVLRPAKIEMCLWYCIYAAPKECPNTAKNVLRSPFGLQLLEFYLDIFGRGGNDEYLTEVLYRAKKWFVWNYFLANRDRKDLSVEVKAQYQNYCIHKDKLILLAGKCETPFKSVFNIIDAEAAHTLFENVTNTSTKFDDIDKLKLSTTPVDCVDPDGFDDKLTHVKINVKTCWPVVICPVTKLHWKECVGQYDVKSGSLVRVFNRYCSKRQAFPEDHMDLVLFYSRLLSNVPLKKQQVNHLKYVYDLFKDVMTAYTCKEYLSVYNEHTDEKCRLSKE